MWWPSLALLTSCDITSCLGSGPVTNAVIAAAPANMFLPDCRPAVPLPRFSRHLQAPEGGESGEVCVRLGLDTQVRLQERDVTSFQTPSTSAFRFECC